MLMFVAMELTHHDYDEEGDRDSYECQKRIESQETVVCQCDSGDCCRHLIIEATKQDAEREPLIAKLGQPIRDLDDEEAWGYLLNNRNGDCRLFNCDDPTEQRRVRPHEDPRNGNVRSNQLDDG